MLGKLIRYDSRVQFRFLGGVCIVVMLVSIVAGILKAVRNAFPDSTILGMVSGLAFGGCVIAAVVLVFGMMIYVVAYFRRNLFRDEGYLMHTLPVTGTELFFSKLITGTISVYLAAVAAVVCISIGALRWDLVDVAIDILKAGGVQNGMYGILVANLLLVVPYTLCQFYVSLVVGYTLRTNSSASRDLFSVAAYLILYLIQQIVSLVAVFIWVVIAYGNPFQPHFQDRLSWLLEADAAQVDAQKQMMLYIYGILGLSLGLLTVLSVVFAVVSIWRMNHRLNLE